MSDNAEVGEQSTASEVGEQCSVSEVGEQSTASEVEEQCSVSKVGKQSTASEVVEQCSVSESQHHHPTLKVEVEVEMI